LIIIPSFWKPITIYIFYEKGWLLFLFGAFGQFKKGGGVNSKTWANKGKSLNWAPLRIVGTDWRFHQGFF